MPVSFPDAKRLCKEFQQSMSALLWILESVVEVENVGLQLAGWILNQKIVEHIFGPNLHVEVIKQSHVLLNFLAVEGKITNEHINVIWQASQLKHCSKQVHDLLLPLIKNLEAGPVLHLYELLKELPVKVRIKGMQISSYSEVIWINLCIHIF